MYKFYLGNILLPVAPEKITITAKAANSEYTLIDFSQINVLNGCGLKEFSFDALLPAVKYPFASYEGSFLEPKFYIDEIEKLRKGKSAFNFKILRPKPKSGTFFNELYKVSLESYTIKEDAREGFDITVSIKLKEYAEYRTKRLIIDNNEAVAVQTVRTSDSEAPTAYTVKSGDTLWEICKKILGDGGKYKEVAKSNGVSNPNLIYPGQVIRFE